MATRVYISDRGHRNVALATDDHVLIFSHSHSPNDGLTRVLSNSTTSLPSSGKTPTVPRCLVEFLPRAAADLTGYKSVTTAKGTLGLITLNNEVFVCVVAGSSEVATVRPGETVQRIYAVEFYCLTRSDYDHSTGAQANPYPGQSFTSDEIDYGGGYDQTDTNAEHPFHALKKLLSAGNFYYSVDFDLTRRLQDRIENPTAVDISSLDEGLLWNSYMIRPLLQFRSRLAEKDRKALDNSSLLTTVIRGFVKTLTIPPPSSPIKHKQTSQPASLTLISRLSSRRVGTRFNSRGIDDDGNVANFVESETIFWSPTGVCFSYTQIRGSVPIFWESSSTLIPGQQKIQITRSIEATQPSFDKHIEGLETRYGGVHIVNLLSELRPSEAELSHRYREHVRRSPLRQKDSASEEERHLLEETEFDFHEKTGKAAGGYDGARGIRPLLELSAEAFVYFLSDDIVEPARARGQVESTKRALIVMQQSGTFRVNCLDCLDRTNLVQGIISQRAIELFLEHRNEKATPDFWMRHSTLWADNGDILSKIYAGTGALKSSFTRHGKMSLAGALADARKSATRLYVNHFEDKGRQNTIDLLLGRLVGQPEVDLYDPVNEWVMQEVSRQRLQFESKDQIKVWVGTYNLNGKTTGINEDLRPWLDHARYGSTSGSKDRSHGAEIVVVGFQEIVELSPQQIMNTDPARRMAWEQAVGDTLNDYHEEKGAARSNPADDYILLRSGQLVGAALLVYVKAGTLPRLKNVEGAIKKTGMSGIAGNKGACAIRMEIESTSVCFVTAHLAAGFGNYEERNRDYNTITSGLRFQRGRSIDDHEIVVWAGDFNYRIGLGHDRTRHLVGQVMSSTTTKDDREEALGRLYENDQLNIQMVAGRCFTFFSEGRVKFLPTYKFDLGRDDYDSSEKARIPAWTDRILWKVNLNKTPAFSDGADDFSPRLKQIEYDSVMDLRFSDHRPIYSKFEMGIRVVDHDKKEELVKKLYEKRLIDVRHKLERMHSGYEGSGDLLDSSSDSETMEYQSIQEGLPPASSDRKKWWLDDNRVTKSSMTPPNEGWVLNPSREANPWRDGGESDWVDVQALQAKVEQKASKLNQPASSMDVTGAKPEPPAPRGSNRVVSTPKPINGDSLTLQSEPKTVSHVLNRAGLDGATESGNIGRSSPAPPPPPSRTAAHRDRTASIASVSSMTSHYSTATSGSYGTPRKQPPVKPAKPAALTSTITRTLSEASTPTPTISSPDLGPTPDADSIASRLTSMSLVRTESPTPVAPKPDTSPALTKEMSAPPPLPSRGHTIKTSRIDTGIEKVASPGSGLSPVIAAPQKPTQLSGGFGSFSSSQFQPSPARKPVPSSFPPPRKGTRNSDTSTTSAAAAPPLPPRDDVGLSESPTSTSPTAPRLPPRVTEAKHPDKTTNGVNLLDKGGYDRLSKTDTWKTGNEESLI